MDVDDVIAAFRDVHTDIARTQDAFTVDKKADLLLYCEVLIDRLKRGGFLKALQAFGADEPDAFDYLMEEVLLKLQLESVDPLYALIAKEQRDED